MPLTPNGKINLKALSEPNFSSMNIEYIALETPLEKIVSESMKKILSISEEVGATHNFYELGGDSINAIRMASLIRQSGFRVRVSDIMKAKTVRGIAAVLTKEEIIGTPRQAIEGEIPDTAIIRYFKYLDLPEPYYFNKANLWSLREPCGRELLQKAIDAVVQHHDMLRAV
ncbi:MAG: hypothetical protein IJS81_08025 [Selenomonadaceae bacterium]|nr:hypothetical protein [Selenomonadaceae bacterium]